MTVKDLISLETDTDVVDDVCEELYIAFVGPVELTAAGKSEFQTVLDLEVLPLGDCTIVCVDDTGAEWKQRLRAAKHFFNAAAGYCSAADYKRWFVS